MAQTVGEDLLCAVIILCHSNPLSNPEKAAYPDTVAVALDTVNHRVSYGWSLLVTVK